MKVLLLQDVRGVGRRMEIREVKEGYARNFLIAKKLAVPANEEAMQIKKEADAKEEKVLFEFREAAQKLAKERLEFIVKVGKNNEVFGAISAAEIKSALLQKGRIKKDAKVTLLKPLKSLGEHFVEVNFGRGIRGRAAVILRSQQ